MDNKTDLITSNFNTNNLTVLLNATVCGSATKVGMVNNSDVNNGTDVSAYPNPFKDEIYIQVEGEPNQTSVILILDIHGKELSRETVKNNQQIAIGAKLKSGVYFIKNLNTSKTYKIVKTE